MAAFAGLAVLLIGTIIVLAFLTSTDSLIPRTGRGSVGPSCDNGTAGGCTTAWGQHVWCPNPPTCPGNSNCTTEGCELSLASTNAFYEVSALALMEVGAMIALIALPLRGHPRAP